MKNFKQLIPALVVCMFVIGGVVLANTTQAPNSCTPPGCNVENTVNTGSTGQLKNGALEAKFFGATGDIEARDGFYVGTDTSIEPKKTGLRVLLGQAWTKGKVYIGQNIPVSAIVSTTPPTPVYTLTLKPGSTTNLGKGDFCTLTNQDLNGGQGCPPGSFVSQINPNWANGNVPQVACTFINPSDNPANLGSCLTNILSLNVGMARTYDAAGSGVGYCQYTVTVYNAPSNVSISISKWANTTYPPNTTAGTITNYETKTTGSGTTSTTFGTTTAGSGQYDCTNLNGGDIMYRANLTISGSGEQISSGWTK